MYCGETLSDRAIAHPKKAIQIVAIFLTSVKVSHKSATTQLFLNRELN
jgi:hypothetical protein